MRQFSLILCFCLAAVASADKLGYNYQPVAHSPSGLSFQPSGLPSNEAPAFAAGPSFQSSGLGSNDAPSFQPSGSGSFQPSGLASNEAPNFAPALAAPIDGPIGASSSGAGISQGPFVPVGLPEATAPISSYVQPPTPGNTYLPANILRRLRF
ncbi:Hypothetical predicted protein [Drosophila guanche]|uniref:Uncharacterized protein n=1 Tax=Drosophila guanche TaxID=7266 RepID=A0A3B0KBW9_DROGU|nr:Hypothetical predicted protein [Drosophila guanche]